MQLPKNTDDPDSPIGSVQTIAQFLRVNRALGQIGKKTLDVNPKVEEILLKSKGSVNPNNDIND